MSMYPYKIFEKVIEYSVIKARPIEIGEGEAGVIPEGTVVYALDTHVDGKLYVYGKLVVVGSRDIDGAGEIVGPGDIELVA